MTAKSKADKEAEKALEGIDKVLGLFQRYGVRKRQSEDASTNSGDMFMTLGQAQSFIALALNETMSDGNAPSLSDLVDITGVPQSTLSRRLLDLGIQDRNRKPGFGLLEGETDPMSLRTKRYHLTPRGKELKAELVAVWEE